MGLAGLTNAQFDDIYFNPSDADEIFAQIDLEKYSDESYETKSVKPDDYDYYYASRIRRFDSPYYGFDFYSPVYVDPYYYNRAYANFYRPGTSIYWGGPVPASTIAYGYESYASPSAIYGGTTISSGYGGYNNGYGGLGTTGSYNGYGASYGGGVGGYGSSYGGGGYNAYCPPSVGGIYGNPTTGVFQPGTTSAPNPNTRSGSAAAGNTVYGPRGGGVGSVTTSPRNTTTGTGAPAPDRPLAGTAVTGSPRAGQKTYAGESAAGARSASYAGPRKARPAYSAPFLKTDNVRSRFSSNRPSRPTTNSYSPSSRSYSGSSSRSTYSRPSSSSGTRSSSTRSSSTRSSSSGSFSSPRSSGSSSRSSGASRSGGSPRGGS